MSLSDEKAADLAGLLDEIGEPVTWNGRSYKALVSDPAIGEHLDIGGFTGTGDFTIKIPRASFDKRLPKLGELIEFEGGSFPHRADHKPSPISSFGPRGRAPGLTRHA